MAPFIRHFLAALVVSSLPLLFWPMEIRMLHGRGEIFKSLDL